MNESDDDLDDDALVQAVDCADRHLEATKPRDVHLNCLKSTFGHSAFRPKQWEIIRAIIEERRDVCAVMPTGYGKSLCFQFPAVFTKGITLVVSPLISLMQDQVLSLEVANIPACFLGSAQRDQNIESKVLNDEFRIVYASPEYLTGDRGKDLLRQLESKLTLIAIDEAHCVSQWGHDFRRDYRRLNEIRDVVTKVPMLSVTATATPQVRDDIAQSLRMRNVQFVSMGSDRPNIEFNFRAKSENAWTDLKAYTTNVRGSVIVYVMRKIDAEQMAKLLKENGVQCEFYHAGVAMKKRQEILEDFTRDRLQVIVATVAFGMGIDKPDVRYVIHYGVSKNLETYYQEVGRAGRDGQPSKAITFFNKKDFSFQQWLLNENHDKKSAAVQRNLQDLAQKMKDFCYTAQCRRAFILKYFGSDVSHLAVRSDCCDNCKRGVSTIKLSERYQGMDDAGNYDFTESARLYLGAMNLTSKTSLAALVLKGSMSKDSQQYKNEQLFGAGRLRAKGYWEAIQQQLKVNQMLTTKVLPAPYRPITVISERGLNWLRREPKERLVLKAIPEMLALIPRKRPNLNNNNTIAAPPPTSVTSKESHVPEVVVMNDRDLETILLGIRAALAENANCMPFTIASNVAINQMVETKPMSIKEFKRTLIEGFSVAKVEKFAPAFVDGIVKFTSNEFDIAKILMRCPMKCAKSTLSTESQKRLRDLIHRNSSLATICESMDLTESTAIAEIVILLRTGHNITKAHFGHLIGVDDGIFEHIKSKAVSSDMQRVDDIDQLDKSKFCANTNITEQMLVLVLNYLKVRKYLELTKTPYFDASENTLANATAFIRKHTKSIPSDASITGTSTNAKRLSDGIGGGEGDEFEDEMIGKILVQWSQMDKEANENERSNDENNVQNNEQSVLDVSVDELLDPETIENMFTDWNEDSENLPVKSNRNDMPSTSGIGERKPPRQRVYVKPKTKIQYCSDSDSDDEIQAAPLKPQRSLPKWMTQRPAPAPAKTGEFSPKRIKKAKF